MWKSYSSFILSQARHQSQTSTAHVMRKFSGGCLSLKLSPVFMYHLLPTKFLIHQKEVPKFIVQKKNHSQEMKRKSHYANKSESSCFLEIAVGRISSRPFHLQKHFNFGDLLLRMSILPEDWLLIPEGVHQNIIWQNFCRKLHENERDGSMRP